jgi:hypothetical protein
MLGVWRFLRLSTLTLLCLFVVHAQARAAQRMYQRLAVLEFSGRQIEGDVLGAFTDAVRGGAVEGLTGRDVKVMTRENMMVMLRDMGKSECSEGDCDVETARNIGADFVVSASVVRIDDAFVVTLKLHEVKEGGLLATDTVQAKSQLETLNQLRQHGRDLVARNIASSRIGANGGLPPTDRSIAPAAGSTGATPEGAASGQPPTAARTAVTPASSAPVPAPETDPSPPAATEATTAPSPAGGGSNWRTWAIVAGSVGIVGVGTGVVLSVLTQRTRQQVESDGRQGFYDPSKDSRGRTYATLQWVGYGVGAAGLLTAAVVSFVGASAAQPAGRQSVAVAPVIGPGQGGVLLQGSF